MGAGEGIIWHAGVDDALHRRERLDVAFEMGGGDRLPRETNVGDGDLIALAIAAGLRRAGQVRLERGQRRLVPVMSPFQDAGLVDLVFMGEVLAHPRHDQRMRVAGDELGKAAHPRPRLRLLRQQRRLRMRLLGIFFDDPQFEQYHSLLPYSSPPYPPPLPPPARTLT